MNRSNLENDTFVISMDGWMEMCRVEDEQIFFFIAPMLICIAKNCFRAQSDLWESVSWDD